MDVTFKTKSMRLCVLHWLLPRKNLRQPDNCWYIRKDLRWGFDGGHLDSDGRCTKPTKNLDGFRPRGSIGRKYYKITNEKQKYMLKEMNHVSYGNI